MASGAGLWRRTVALVYASFLASLLLPATVGATHHGEGVVDEVTLELSYRSSSLAGAPGQLVALLQLDDGSPLVGATVDFWREVEFLGPRHVPLGRAPTGADGTAQIPLSPPESPARVGARFAGGESYLAADGTIEISRSVAPPRASEAPAEDSGAGLAVVSEAMPVLLTLAAVTVWVLLIGLTVATALAIRRGGRRPSAATRRERS